MHQELLVGDTIRLRRDRLARVINLGHPALRVTKLIVVAPNDVFELSPHVLYVMLAEWVGCLHERQLEIDESSSECLPFGDTLEPDVVVGGIDEFL